MTRETNTQSRRTAIVATAVVLTLVAGLFLVRTARDSTRPDPILSTSGSTAAPGTTIKFTAPAQSGDAPETPLDNSKNEPGAVDAAVAYATASQRWLYFTDEEIKTAIAAIATRNAAPRMTKEVTAEVSMVRDQLAQSKGSIWWIVCPLAWRVEQFNGNDARVSVWAVTVLSAAGVAAPQSEYLTVVLDLEWVDGGWRVDGVRDTPGPTPITGPKDQPWDAEPFDQVLDGFTRMGEEPVS